MNTIYIVYRAYNEHNKSYIGFSSKSLNQRKSTHFKAAKSKKYPFYLALQKYNFTWELLGSYTNKKLALQKEKDFIVKFNSKVPNGYNLTDGGEGTFGALRSNKWKKQRSKAMKAKLKDKNNINYKVLELRKIKVIRSDGKIYKSITSAAKAIDRTPGEIYNNVIGKTASVKDFDFNALEQRNLIKLKTKNRLKAKKAKEQQKKVIVDNNGIVYSSLSEAARKLNLKVGNISKVLHGKRMSTGGMTFSFKKTT